MKRADVFRAGQVSNHARPPTARTSGDLASNAKRSVTCWLEVGQHFDDLRQFFVMFRVSPFSLRITVG